MRTWERAVKYYQSMRLVYDVQTRLSEMTEQADTQSKADSASKTKDKGPSGQGARSQGEKK
jgi:hypothetical protein